MKKKSFFLGEKLKNFNRKDFLKLSLASLVLAKSKRALAKDKNEKLLELRGRVMKLKSSEFNRYESIQGPGKIIITKTSDGLVYNNGNITLRDIDFVAEDSTKEHSSVIHLLEGVNSITIDNCSFEGRRYCILKADKNATTDRALTFKKPVKNVLFINNKVKGSYSRHLYLHNIEDVLISKNFFSDSLRDSIRLRQKIKKVIISENTFTNIGQKSKESADAVDSFWSGEELIITRNIIDKCDKHGLDIKGMSPDMKGATGKVIITENEIFNCQFSGILISSGSFVQTKKNVVKDFIISKNIFRKNNLNNKNPNDAAIFLRHGVQDVIITENIIKEQKGHGIVLGNFALRVEQTKNIIIAKNIIHTDKSAKSVLSFAADNVLVENNILHHPAGERGVQLLKSYKTYMATTQQATKNVVP